MKHILQKLTKEEVKELSQAIQEAQSKKFGNPLSLRKQEELMAEVFSEKNWSTVLGLAQGLPNSFPVLKGMVSKAIEILKGKPSLEGKKWKEYALTLNKEREDLADCLCWANVLVKEEDQTQEGFLRSEDREKIKKEFEIKDSKNSCKKCGSTEFEDFGEVMVPRYFCKGCGTGTGVEPKEGELQKTTIEFIVLSRDEYPEPMNLAQVNYDISQGDCLGYFKDIKKEYLTGSEMKNEILEAGSDESFFEFFGIDELTKDQKEVLKYCIEDIDRDLEIFASDDEKTLNMIEARLEQERVDAVISLNRSIEEEDVSEWEHKVLSVADSINRDMIAKYIEEEL